MKTRIFAAGSLAVGLSFWSASADVHHPGDDRVHLSANMRQDLALEVGIVELRKVAGSKDPVIAIPEGALVDLPGSDGGPMVYLQKAGDGADRFVRQNVEVGRKDQSYVEIRSGLFPGDTIVVKNADRIPRRGGEFAGDGKGGGGGFIEHRQEPEIARAEARDPVAPRADGALPQWRRAPGMTGHICPPPNGIRFVRPPAYEIPRTVCPPGPVFRSRAPFGRSRGSIGMRGRGFYRPVCPPHPCPW